MRSIFAIPMPREILRAQAACVILCLILLVIFQLMQLIMFQAAFQRAHAQQVIACLRRLKQSFRMIRNGRTPNLRHVSRTHRVDLDRLVE